MFILNLVLPLIHCHFFLLLIFHTQKYLKVQLIDLELFI